ncbi:hypothetical protein BDQ17DRAFT_1234754 [Cyathus striatus]|nr:hypothetical protein BDQ17DRAFT_1234754 [Cyathus striatus]
MRRRAESTSDTRFPTSKLVPLSIYSHVSSYRSLQLEMQLYSPSLKAYEDGQRGPLAVYSEHDHVGGKVIIDAKSSPSGRLTISIEGSFKYYIEHLDDHASNSGVSSDAPQKHVFLSSSAVVHVSPNAESNFPRSAFKDAFIRRRPSAPALHVSGTTGDRSFPFRFDLPQSCRPREEMPASFSSSSESMAVSYKVTALWEPNDELSDNSLLEVPILIQPDAEFQSLDALSGTHHESWLEMPLKPERPMPYRCAATLPTDVTFSRSSSIPYFVVFTTIPRSQSLAKEIAADATISVSLVRQITLTEQLPLPPTPPLTPSSDESDSFFPQRKLLKRVAKTAQPRIIRPRRPSEVEVREKPLPAIPTVKVYHDTRSLKNEMCIGFPKRPRQLCDGTSHPSLEAQNALPDGLHRSKIILSKDMLPCIDWAGISVKYYLDVSVLIGQDDLRARIPIRIL